ncbi:MAG: pectinesterase family protein [Nibricoccus sp.]
MKRLITLLAAAALVPAAFAATRSVPSQYSTIQAAVNAAAAGDTISIANGTYNEQVTIASSKTKLNIVGASQTGVILSSGDGQTSLTVNGTDITVSYMTIRNTLLSGSTTSHAVRVNSKRVEFYRCYINGWQDTFAIWNDALVYCKFCEIRGCVDYVYSGGTAFFESTNVRQVRTTGGVDCAPSTPQNVTYGFVFSGCTITRASGVGSNNSTLMRPWYPYGATAYINCTMDAHITAAGWSPWDGREATCRAAEYGSKTPAGATINLATRSSWVKRLTSAQAATYTRSNVLGGWTPPLL